MHYLVGLRKHGIGSLEVSDILMPEVFFFFEYSAELQDPGVSEVS